MITQCCYCKRFKSGEEWGNLFILPIERFTITHGICPKCFDEQMKQLNNERSDLASSALDCRTQNSN